MTQNHFYAYSIEKYNNYINSTELPEWFVTYDQLAHIGTFRGFSFRSYEKLGQYNAYWYSITTPSGGDVFLSIDYLFGNGGTFLTYGTDYSEMHTGDLRTIEYKEQGYIWVEDMLYGYIDGELQSVKWTDSNNQYVLSIDNALEIDLNEQPAFIKNILHTDTAIAGIEAFSAELKAAKK